MGFERDLSAVAPILLTANGGATGQLQLATTLGIFVKQIVILKGTSLPNLAVEVKRVLSPTTITVGPPKSASMTAYVDVSAYTLAAGSFLYAEVQPKAILPMESRLYGSYIQEPSNSWRVTPVDSFGNSFDETNPLPVAFDGTVSIGDVHILGPSPDNNELNVNADGSINVNVVQSPVTGHNVRSIFNKVSSVASGIETVIVSYTVPFGSTAVLERITSSGNNVAEYNVYLNASPFDSQRTYFGGEFNASFDYTTGTSDGLTLTAGDVLSVKVIQDRPFVGDFSARIQVLEIN